VYWCASNQTFLCTLLNLPRRIGRLKKRTAILTAALTGSPGWPGFTKSPVSLVRMLFDNQILQYPRLSARRRLRRGALRSPWSLLGRPQAFGRMGCCISRSEFRTPHLQGAPPLCRHTDNSSGNGPRPTAKNTMEQYRTVSLLPLRNSMEQYKWCCPKTGIADKIRPEQYKISMKQHTDQYGRTVPPTVCADHWPKRHEVLHRRHARGSPTNGKNAQNSMDQCAALSLIS
jgi:hypothetical protein